MQSSVQSWPRESRLKREPHNTHICLHFQSIHLPLDQLKREKQEGKYKKDQNWRFTSDIGREENTTLCLKKQNTILSNVIFFSFDLEPENTACAKHENTRISLSSGPMLLKRNKWRGKYMLHIFKQSVTKSGLVLHRWISSDKSETGATFTFLFLSQRIFQSTGIHSVFLWASPPGIKSLFVLHQNAAAIIFVYLPCLEWGQGNNRGTSVFWCFKRLLAKQTSTITALPTLLKISPQNNSLRIHNQLFHSWLFWDDKWFVIQDTI